MARVLAAAYPTAELAHNPNGKPRKGAFEVEVNGQQLYSKLEQFGPKKDRAALPDPSEMLAKITQAVGDAPKKAAKAAAPKKEAKPAPKAATPAKKAAKAAAPKKAAKAAKKANPPAEGTRRSARVAQR
eukprot:TRINITY_DN8657_c0_g1_i1.p1 TRINITY_DN8657_c0_g1~~TRINITY_DN8657_c0_g1_i1.p1  ORF type:complete len:129 (-),score=49.60 TRINITY_DN8657_c0_g1_i1:79-465(-)